MFNLGHIASAYYAYITSSSEIDKENLVAQHLSNNEILDSSESELNEKFESFITHLRLYVELDELAWNHYTRILPIYEQKFDTENDGGGRLCDHRHRSTFRCLQGSTKNRFGTLAFLRTVVCRYQAHTDRNNNRIAL